MFGIFYLRFLWPFPGRGWLEAKDDILPGDIEGNREGRIHHYQRDQILLEILQLVF
jgi:hypothetical protein